MTARPFALILSFSPIARDARVLKQVSLLAETHQVVTCGYGEPPVQSVRHIRIPDDCRVDDPQPNLLIRRRYRKAYWRMSGVRWVVENSPKGEFDVVIANDVEAVPIALALRAKRGVLADLHEYSPRLHDDRVLWRARNQPFLEWLCQRYVSRAQAWTTVSAGLAREYHDRFGFRPEVVTNATPYKELRETPVGSPIRLVHSGAGLRNRSLMLMAEAVETADADVTLDFYLTPNHPDHVDELRRFAELSTRVTVHDPVPYERLVETLHQYDVGLFVLPPITFNYRWALPNKLFDFVQARLGVLIGPSPEMAAYVRAHGIGEIADDFTVDATRRAVERLSRERVASMKENSSRCAAELSSGPQLETWRRVISDLGVGQAPRRIPSSPPTSQDPVRDRLVLLTNEYPLDRGDATFVANEIDALAAHFDEVVVFNFPGHGAWSFRSVPGNVRYGGSLKEATRAEAILRMVRPGTAARWVRAVWREVRHGRVGRKALLVIITTAAAAVRAGHPELRRAIRQRGVRTTVYAFWGMGAGAAVACLPRVSGRVAVRLHRYDLYEEVNGWLPLRGSLLTQPDVLLPISDHAAQYLRQTYAWPDLSPVVVSRLGTRDWGAAPRPSDMSELTVVSCSAISPVKRVALLLRALKEVSVTVPVRWVHFGDGPLRSQVEREAALLEDARFRIEFRGQTPNSELMSFYLNNPAHVFANVSDSEGVPVSIMEAMSVGIPIVATRVGGVAEVVGVEKGSGTLVDATATAAEIAEAILWTAGAKGLDPRVTWNRLSNADTNVRTLLKELLP